MPAYDQQRPALNGRGVVFSYITNPSKFYWRQLVEGERRYRTRLIANASTIEQALAGCIDAYAELQATETRPEGATQAFKPSSGVGGSYAAIRTATNPQTRPQVALTGEIANFLKHEQQRVEAGIIKETTMKSKKIILGIHLTNYLQHTGVANVEDITPSFLDDYIIWRGDKSKLTRQKELINIKDFIDNWLIRNELLNKIVDVKKPRIRKADLTANPAITPKDWRIINNYIRNVYVKKVETHPNPSVHYWRVLFWTFTTLAKQTGARPAELLALKWKDVDVEDVGRYSKTHDEVEERLISFITIRNSKTGDQREVPSNSGGLFKRWAEYQRRYLKEHYSRLSATRDTLIFGNPKNDLQVHTYCQYTAAWKVIMTGVGSKLEGNKFSDKQYTIYSFRSSFIEDHISKGTDIYLLSRLAGHSIAMLQRHYDRSDVRKFSDEITKLPYGKKGKVRKVIDLFD